MATGSVQSADTIFKNYGAFVSNLNTAIETGYGYTSAAVGAPSGYPNGFFVTFNTGAVGIQIYVPYFSNTLDNPIKVRYYASSAWGNWSNIL